MKKTIVYITDNSLDYRLMNACMTRLRNSAGSIPIISVSQKPIDLGLNVNVGDIGRSWLNIYKQQLEGLKIANTEFVMIAEHDVLYTEEHCLWIPPDNETFWYNSNCWLVEWSNDHPEMRGMYSQWKKDRKALSQLVCDRKLLIQSIEERLELIDSGIKEMRRLGEPGAFNNDVIKGAQLAVSGASCHLAGLLDKHLKKYKSGMFKTEHPNLDIRHGNNFTGPRRGNNRRYEIEPWGNFNHFMASY